MKHQQKDLTHVLHRSIESAGVQRPFIRKLGNGGTYCSRTFSLSLALAIILTLADILRSYSKAAFQLKFQRFFLDHPGLALQNR